MLATWQMQLANRAASVLLPPSSAAAHGLACPAGLAAILARVLDGSQLRKHAKNYAASFVHEVEPSVWAGEDALAPLMHLLNLLCALRTQPPPWLARWKPLVMHQHGDLNLANVLVDARDGVWLIDYARSGDMPPFTDAAFFISRLLFQHFPIRACPQLRPDRTDEFAHPARC